MYGMYVTRLWKKYNTFVLNNKTFSYEIMFSNENIHIYHTRWLFSKVNRFRRPCMLYRSSKYTHFILLYTIAYYKYIQNLDGISSVLSFIWFYTLWLYLVVRCNFTSSVFLTIASKLLQLLICFSRNGTTTTYSNSKLVFRNWL